MSEHLIPNDLIQWHFATLSHCPELLEKLHKRQLVPAEVLKGSGQTLTADEFARLLKYTFLESNDESFAQLNVPVYRGSFQMMCHACISGINLQQVIERCIQFYKIFNPQFDWQLIIEGNTSFIEFNFKHMDYQRSSYLVAFISVVIWRWLSWIINKQIELDSIEFSFQLPVAAKNIEPIFKRAVKQNSDKNRISFNTEYLKFPVKQTSQSLELFLINVPECLLSHYQQEMSLSGQLKEFLKQQDNLNELTLADAAQHFCCSEQSLIRKLKSEGTKFKKEVDSIQKRRARQLVLTASMTNQQIANHLGYPDVSIFYRKFKQWFQQTPSEFRESD